MILNGTGDGPAIDIFQLDLRVVIPAFVASGGLIAAMPFTGWHTHLSGWPIFALLLTTLFSGYVLVQRFRYRTVDMTPQVPVDLRGSWDDMQIYDATRTRLKVFGDDADAVIADPALFLRFVRLERGLRAGDFTAVCNATERARTALAVAGMRQSTHLVFQQIFHHYRQVRTHDEDMILHWAIVASRADMQEGRQRRRALARFVVNGKAPRPTP